MGRARNRWHDRMETLGEQIPTGNKAMLGFLEAVSRTNRYLRVWIVPNSLSFETENDTDALAS